MLQQKRKKLKYVEKNNLKVYNSPWLCEKIFNLIIKNLEVSSCLKS